MATIDLALLRLLPLGRDRTVQTECRQTLVVEARGEPAAHDAARVGSGQVGGQQRHVVRQGQGHVRLVEGPVPAVALSSGALRRLVDQVLHVARLLTACAVDVGLALEIKLLHHDGRPPSGGEGATQQVQPQPMLLRVVMHFAEQDDGVAGEARFPGLHGRDGGARSDDADEAWQRKAKRLGLHALQQAMKQDHGHLRTKGSSAVRRARWARIKHA